MLAKIVALFLVFIAVIAMFGKLRVPGQKHIDRFRTRRLSAAPCPACGRHKIGKGPCPCGKKG
ncbi:MULTISPECIES: hypothetical protein [Ponticoccus]|uniref:Short-chain dehydrogenase n=1 Tax=Ponticoccus litoralis TaxID=422297 RepID=A0AAW9SKE0_9RHOB